MESQSHPGVQGEAEGDGSAVGGQILSPGCNDEVSEFLTLTWGGEVLMGKELIIPH